ncbi:MAG: sigma-54 dependent transcriptional regulator [Kiritimatiellae bacterium]|nr:sigma-54 dependent transcriptional regulator [Kiritimatiellia bacterium]
MSPRILIIEDDADHGQSLLEAVRGMGFEAEWVSSGREGVEAFRERGADVVLSDLVMPDIDGIEVMQRLREMDDGRTPVIVMTAYGSVDSSVQAMKEGAYDYLQKPLDIDDLEAKLSRALEAARLRGQVERLNAEVRNQWGARSWVAESPVMREIVRQTVTLAQTHATVLIRGESGTGKELVARALHADGPRTGGPFVAVNCAAFAESLLESELFGHEKGAFTGAVARRAGAFERAQGGTLFLDEIGDAPPAVQVKLLRVLEDRAIVRVGGQQSFQVDVRLVSATHRDLDAQVAAGTFRQDVLYRLQVVGITLPPLRDRREDIRPLAEHFMALAQHDHGRCIQAVEPAWYERLKAYAWPGNIRELRNVVEAAVVMTPDGVLRVDRLQMGGGAAPSVQGEWSVPEGMTLDDMEKRILAEALRRNDGNRSLTAEQLGISRRTIQRKIQDYDLPF